MKRQTYDKIKEAINIGRTVSSVGTTLAIGVVFKGAVINAIKNTPGGMGAKLSAGIVTGSLVGAVSYAASAGTNYIFDIADELVDRFHSLRDINLLIDQEEKKFSELVEKFDPEDQDCIDKIISTGTVLIENYEEKIKILSAGKKPSQEEIISVVARLKAAQVSISHTEMLNGLNKEREKANDV